MIAYITNRLTQTIIVILVVSFISFSFLHIMPGDPATIMIGEDATQEQIDALRNELGLNQPFIVQYGYWLNKVLHGDFGRSIAYHKSVSSLLLSRLPVSGYLALIASVFSIILGILAGTVCAIRRGSILDNVISVFANIGIAIPLFWLGVLGIYFVGLKLDWLPIQGYTSPTVDFGKSTAQAVMPVICLAIPFLAVLTRQSRSSMLEVIRQDYILTARAKGLRERVVVLSHALKNALIPVVTIMGLQVRILIGGAVLVETVFNIPGMGMLLMDAVYHHDFPVIQAGIMVLALAVCLANLGVDIVYAWLDPQIKI